jgi:periplasmic protein TonB
MGACAARRWKAATSVLLLHAAVAWLALGSGAEAPAQPRTSVALAERRVTVALPAAAPAGPALRAAPLPARLALAPVPAAVPLTWPAFTVDETPAQLATPATAPREPSGDRRSVQDVAALMPTPAAPPPLQAARRQACPPASHPALLKERGIEGTVRLRAWVDERGGIDRLQVTQASGYRLFDEAALSQGRRCQFEPAREGDRAIGSWVEFTVRFALRTATGAAAVQ